MELLDNYFYCPVCGTSLGGIGFTENGDIDETLTCAVCKNNNIAVTMTIVVKFPTILIKGEPAVLAKEQATYIKASFAALAESLDETQLNALYFRLDDLMQYGQNSLTLAYYAVAAVKSASIMTKGE